MKTTKWFVDCECVEDLKKRFHELAKKHHPDLGGVLHVMQEINAQFDKAFAMLKDVHRNKEGKLWEAQGNWCTDELPQDYRERIFRLIRMRGVGVEICGSWIWVTGDTKPHAPELKEMRFWFSGNKQAWYYNATPKRMNRPPHCHSMDEVRNIWGSKKYKNVADEDTIGIEG